MACYIVTGGCGFIGSHLVDELLKKQHDVIVLDNLSTGKVENLSSKALFIQNCVTDTKFLKQVFYSNKIDGCFHLAAITSVEKSMDIKEVFKTHLTNSGGTVVLLEFCIEQKVPIVFTSSAAVYGSTKQNFLSESCLVNPLSNYGIDKLSCEYYHKIANACYHLPIIDLRLFNVYGPRQSFCSSYSPVIPKFINDIIKKKELVVYGNGEQVRDFVYVADVVKVLIRAMNKIETDRDDYKILNVCSGLGISINTLIKKLEIVFNKKLKCKYFKNRKGDIQHSVGDPSLLEDYLSIKCNTNIEEGLKNLTKF